MVSWVLHYTNLLSIYAYSVLLIFFMFQSESEACSSWKLVGVISHYPSAKSADFGVSKFGYNGMYKSFFL